MSDKFTPTAEMNEVLVKSGSPNREQSLANVKMLAVALEMPLRKGVLSGDIRKSVV